ncbi:phage portal protein [Rhizobium sp. BR 315]|uniref:phage portal protein n=1 Tax=Rhizobium sp. BR 315 TaxID=3040014 RepID=UPI003D327B36
MGSFKDSIMSFFGKSEKRSSIGIGDPAITRILGNHSPLETATNLSTASRAISLISGAYASSDATLYKTAKGGSPVEADTHALYDLMLNGTRDLSAYELKHALMSDLVTYGECFAHVEFDQNGKPTNLTPLSWNNMIVEFLGNGRIVYRWMNPLFNFNQTVYGQSDILHVKHRPFNGRGRSPIQLAALSMGIAVAVEDATSTAAQSGFSAGGILSAPGAISDETAARLQKTVQDNFSGTDKAGRVMVAGDGITLQQFALSAKDSELVANRQFNAYLVAQAYGTPPETVGLPFNSSWGSAQQSDIQLVSHCLNPWSQLLNQSITAFVLSPRERRTFYLASDYSDMTSGTLQDQAAAYASLTTSGIYTKNEAREVFDLPSLPGGDALTTPFNVAAIPHDPAKNGQQQGATA